MYGRGLQATAGRYSRSMNVSAMALLVAAVVPVGCYRLSTNGKNACITDDDCLEGVCVAGSCAKSTSGNKPMATIESTEPNPTDRTSFEVSITFSQAVTGFDQTDLVVGNASVTLQEISKSEYIAEVTPAAPGSVTLDLPAARVQDLAGNESLAAQQFRRTYGLGRPIFRSVGPNKTSAVADSGSGNEFSIQNDGVASFENPLPAEVGVGDLLVFDNDGIGGYDRLVFVHRRNSSNSYTVRTPAGGVPVDADPASDWAIYRAYTSSADAEAGVENATVSSLPIAGPQLGNFDAWVDGRDAVGNGEIWFWALYADDTETDQVEIRDWQTSAEYPLHLFVPFDSSHVGRSQRHVGRWDSSSYHIDRAVGVSQGHPIEVFTQAVRIDGLQIRRSGFQEGSNEMGIRIPSEAKDVSVSNCILVGSGQNEGNFRAIVIADDKIDFVQNRVFRLWNNIFYDWRSGSANGEQAIYFVVPTGSGSMGTAFVYNNTFLNVQQAVRTNWPNVVRLKNNLAICSNTICYDGEFDAGSSRNAANNALIDIPGTAAIELSSTNTIDYFLDDGDFRLDADAARVGEVEDTGEALDADSDLAFDNDIAGTLRPQGNSWDVGAFELSE